MKNFISIDIGGTSVKYGVISSLGEIYMKRECVAYENGEYIMPLLSCVIKSCEMARDYSAENGILLVGIALSVSGDVDTNTNCLVGGSGSIPNWSNINFEKELHAVIDLPVSALNDANAAALGEIWLGCGVGHSDVVMYTIGTGIGGGVVVGGKVMNGTRGFAGNIGHMTIDASGSKCYCGKVGCFEFLASTRALVNNSKQLGYNINGKQFFDMVETDEALQKLLDEFFEYHGIAIGNLIHIFNPELIIIGGGVSSQGERVIGKIRERVKVHTLPHFFDCVQIKQATLGNDAGLIGAVKYHMDKYEV